MEKPWGNHEVTMRFSVQIPGLPEHHWQLNDHTDDSKYDHADDPSACSAINPDLECSPQTTLHAFPSLHTNLSSLICTELSSRVVFPPRTERDTTLLYVSQCCHLPVRSEHHSLLQKRSTVWEIDSHSFTQREMKQLDFSWPSVLAVYTPKHTHTHTPNCNIRMNLILFDEVEDGDWEKQLNRHITRLNILFTETLLPSCLVRENIETHLRKSLWCRQGAGGALHRFPAESK